MMARRLVAVAAAAATLAACTRVGLDAPVGPRSPSVPTPAPVKIAFIEQAPTIDAQRSVAPAFQGAKLALANAGLSGELPVQADLVAMDVSGPGRAAEVVAEIASDPGFVAAIGAPHLGHQIGLGDALDAAGVPWISLSSSGARLGSREWTGFRRLVADDRAQGRKMAAVADALPGAKAGVCVIGDGTPASGTVLRSARSSLRATVLLRDTVSEASSSIAVAAAESIGVGCLVVLWGGDSSAGAELRRELVQNGLASATLIGSDRTKDDLFLQAAGPDGEGSLATCPCVDRSTSTDLATQRFIQDYQAEYGLPPGPYSVEAWDAARMLVSTFRAGASTRADVRFGIDGIGSFDGLGRTYRFGPGGDLLPGTGVVHVYRDDAGRWVDVSAT